MPEDSDDRRPEDELREMLQRFLSGDGPIDPARLAGAAGMPSDPAQLQALMAQLQAYAACSDPDVQATVREAFAGLHRFVATRSGATGRDIHHFFAEGMLLNVGAAVQLEGEPLTWTLDKLGGAD